eukprot:scaffold33925_cov19-Tisochrysis_lutea.AAC.1
MKVSSAYVILIVFSPPLRHIQHSTLNTKYAEHQHTKHGLAISSVGGETAVLLAKNYRSLRELQGDAEAGAVA